MKNLVSKTAVLAAVVAILAFGACASTSGETEPANADCTPNPPLSGPIPFGDGGAGASCHHASDCVPYCCSCPSGGRFLASECVNGHCATQAKACKMELNILMSQGISPCQ